MAQQGSEILTKHMRPSQSSWKLFRMVGLEEAGRAANGLSSEKEVSNQSYIRDKTNFVIKEQCVP